jgi:hypothetical protein
MSGFDVYRKPKPRGKWGCAICGADGVGRVQVTLQERRDQGRGPGQINRYAYPSVDSKSATFCEEHAIEVYEAVKALFFEKSGRTDHGDVG